MHYNLIYPYLDLFDISQTFVKISCGTISKHSIRLLVLVASFPPKESFKIICVKWVKSEFISDGIDADSNNLK